MANNRGLKKSMANYKISPNKLRFLQICVVVLLLRLLAGRGGEGEKICRATGAGFGGGRGSSSTGLHGLDLMESMLLPPSAISSPFFWMSKLRKLIFPS
jgi:hypothetical protein